MKFQPVMKVLTSHVGLNRAERRAKLYKRKSLPLCTKKHTKCRLKYQAKK